MRRRRTNFNIKPSVATHFPSLSKGFNIDPDVHMFTDDIHLAIMPIGGRTDRRDGFIVEFQGEELECEKAKIIIGELGEFDNQDVVAMVCDAVHNIARHLAWEGQAVYEIIKYDEQIYVHRFTPKYLFKLILWFLQIIPPGDWSLWKRKFTLVNKKRIWNIKIPQELGGIRGYKRVLKRLRKYDHLGPKFYREDIELGLISKNYDFKKYVRNSELYFSRATHKWGWNRRDWSQERCTEFYLFYKMLSFKNAQAVLREHIINEINQLLNRLSIKSNLVVYGLPTTNELLEIKNSMQSGELSFKEVSDKLAM